MRLPLLPLTSCKGPHFFTGCCKWLNPRSNMLYKFCNPSHGKNWPLCSSYAWHLEKRWDFPSSHLLVERGLNLHRVLQVLLISFDKVSPVARMLVRTRGKGFDNNLHHSVHSLEKNSACIRIFCKTGSCFWLQTFFKDFKELNSKFSQIFPKIKVTWLLWWLFYLIFYFDWIWNHF